MIQLPLLGCRKRAESESITASGAPPQIEQDLPVRQLDLFAPFFEIQLPSTGPNWPAECCRARLNTLTDKRKLNR